MGLPGSKYLDRSFLPPLPTILHHTTPNQGNLFFFLLRFCILFNLHRCEVFIFAGEASESLLTGLVKPFVAHIRVAQEQVERGSHIIRLDPSMGNNRGLMDRAYIWFTKGTVERFEPWISLDPPIVGPILFSWFPLSPIPPFSPVIFNLCTVLIS